MDTAGVEYLDKIEVTIDPRAILIYRVIAPKGNPTRLCST